MAAEAKANVDPTKTDGINPRTYDLWSDGAPASDIGMIVESIRDPRVELDMQRVRSQGGVARIDGLAPGPFWISADRGGSARAEVVAGEEREVFLQLRGGVSVEIAPMW